MYSDEYYFLIELCELLFSYVPKGDMENVAHSILKILPMDDLSDEVIAELCEINSDIADVINDNLEEE